MRKHIVGTVAGGLLVGGLAGTWLGVPAISSAASDLPASEIAPDESTDAAGIRHLRPARALDRALGQLVEAGTLTRSQADAVVDAVREELPDGGRLRHVVGRRLEVAAEVLGTDVADVAGRLADGATLAELAEERDVEVQALVDALVQEAEARIAQALADGRIDEERAAARTEGAEERITRFVEEGRRPGPGRGGPHVGTRN